MSTPPTGRFLSTEQELRALLLAAGIRPTAQRVRLAELLFGGADRHVVASELHIECAQRGQSTSLATVYNTLRCFVDAGLMREVSVNADSSFFDTNTAPHAHAFDETTQALTDVPLPDLDLPPGMASSQLTGIDVVYRLRSTPE